MYTLYFDYIHPQDLLPATPRTPQPILLQFHVILSSLVQLLLGHQQPTGVHISKDRQLCLLLQPSAADNSSPVSPSPTHTGPRTGSIPCRPHTRHHGLSWCVPQPCHVQESVFHSLPPHPPSQSLFFSSSMLFPEPWMGEVDIKDISPSMAEHSTSCELGAPSCSS